MTHQLLRIKEQLIKQKLGGVLISSLPDIVYLTGFPNFSPVEREAFILLTPGVCYILTDKRYSQAVRNNVKDFELIELSGKLTFSKALAKLAKQHRIGTLGIEENNLSVNEYKKIHKIFKKFKRFDLKSQRALKEDSEIAFIRKACRLTDAAFGHVLKKIKEGVTEKQLAFEIKLFIEEKRAETSFEPIVAFGKNSSIPHHKPTNQKLKIKDQILIDMGAKVENYCSDMTRTIFFGKASDEQKKMYRTVLEAQKISIEFLISHFSSLISKSKSVKACKLDCIARKYIKSQSYPSIPHSLGHGIGIEVHEAPKISPNSKDILKPGMVFSIEPGIYLPAGRQGIPDLGGIRIEDLILLKKDGVEVITKATKDLIEL